MFGLLVSALVAWPVIWYMVTHVWPLFLSRRANSNRSPGLPFTSTLVLLFRVLGTFSTTGSFARESLLVICRVWCERDGFGGHLLNSRTSLLPSHGE